MVFNKMLAMVLVVQVSDLKLTVLVILQNLSTLISKEKLMLQPQLVLKMLLNLKI